MKSSLLILASIAATACSGGAPTEPSSTSEESLHRAARWEKIYECDDGSVVDVNAAERRELQFVVRSQQAIHTLQDSVECTPFTHLTEPPCPTNGKGEFIFQGRVERGVFHPGDFEEFIGYAPGRGRNTPLPFGGLVDRGPDDTIKFSLGEYGNWIFRGCKAIGR